MHSPFRTLTETISLSHKAYLLCRTASLEELVDAVTETDFAEDEQFPYWADLWHAAIGLGNYMGHHPKLFAGHRCLEIGCGLGLASVVAADLGAEALATDYHHDALAFVQKNAELNGVKLKTATVDWRKPLPEQFDCIIGADLLYEKRHHQPILSALEQMLEEGGAAWIADPCRKEAQHFMELAQKQWQLQTTKVPTLYRNIEQQVQIIRLSRK